MIIRFQSLDEKSIDKKVLGGEWKSIDDFKTAGHF